MVRGFLCKSPWVYINGIISLFVLWDISNHHWYYFKRFVVNFEKYIIIFEAYIYTLVQKYMNGVNLSNGIEIDTANFE